MELSSYETTFKSEQTYWWYTARSKIFEHMLRKYSSADRKPENIRILNIGCGTGILSEQLSRFGEIVSMDYSSDALGFCQKRNLKRLIRGDGESLPFKDNSFDWIFCFDIIEHLENDSEAIHDLKRVLKREGKAIITVPAFRFLWSSFDDLNYHKRRYRKNTFKALLEKQEITIIKLSYYNFFLFPIAMLRRGYEKVFKRNNDKYYIPKVAAFTNYIFFQLFAFERFPLGFMNLPWGVSIMSIVRK